MPAVQRPLSKTVGPLSPGVLKYVACLRKGCDECCALCCTVIHRAVGALAWEV